MIKQINRIENKLLKDRYSMLRETISETMRHQQCSRALAKRYLVAMCIAEMIETPKFDTEEKQQLRSY